MPYELFIALRYLRARRKQVMISIITLIAIAAVAAGVASLIILLSVMTGFREEFQQKILSGTAHLNLLRKDGGTIEGYEELAARMRRVPGVKSATATLYQRVLLQGSVDTDGAILKGVDMSAPRDANELFQFAVEGDPQLLVAPEVDPQSGAKIDRMVVGRELARTVGLKVGDTATVISPQGHLTPMGMAPRYRDFVVAGLFESGLTDYDSTWAYISLEAAQRLSATADVAQVIQMTVYDVDAVKEIGRRVLEAAGDQYTTQDWQELNAPIYAALSYEKLLSGVALLIVICIAALNIIGVLIIVVVEKQRDIAVLKSLGATNRSVMFIFVIQGMMIGIAGMILGVIGGAGFSRFADGRKLVKLPVGAYALDYLPFHTRLTDVIVVVAVALSISFLSTIYPSLSASRLDPVEGLRYE
jgi:lipoprotein-releasing system permease protein